MRSPLLLTVARLAGISTLAACLAGTGCSYDPRIGDNQLKCGPGGACPQGYTCRANTNTCFESRQNDGGMNLPDLSTMETSGPDGRLGGDAIPAEVRMRFLGEWTLGPTSSVTTTCEGGGAQTTLLSPATMPSIMRIMPGIAQQSDLESEWLCNLGLRLDDSGAHLFDGMPTCSASGMGEVRTQTWTATSFDITANNGFTAMHTATYTRVDDLNNGTSVRCAQTVTAPLIKR